MSQDPQQPASFKAYCIVIAVLYVICAAAYIVRYSGFAF